MFYAVLFKNPFIYISNEDVGLLEDDFDFIVENPVECELEEGLLAEEFKALSPAEFTMLLDKEVKEGVIYTYKDAVLVQRYYKKAPCFYVNPEDGIGYSSYCGNSNTIKAGLLTNEQLTPIVSDLLSEYFLNIENVEVSIEPPFYDDEVIAYVCIPIRRDAIPIGIETEEEKEEIQADKED